MMDTKATFYNPYNYCTSTSDLQPSTFVNRLPDQLVPTQIRTIGIKLIIALTVSSIKLV